MQQGRQLTTEQKEAIQGVFFSENIFFNCVQDTNNGWYLFLSEDDILNIGEYSYLLDIPLTIYEAKISENPLI
jgi:hypothetical protein